jgi:phenylpyruvate tautomerase PptA (4-oxalocrotonate tautomerase family)
MTIQQSRAYGDAMAHAVIEVLVGRSPSEKRLLLARVHEAMVTALHVPADDPTVRLLEYPAEHMIIPGRHSQRYTIVVITMFAGRTMTTKRCLYQQLVAGLAEVDVPAADVQVIVHEAPMENWSLEGVPSSETDPGFTVTI